MLKAPTRAGGNAILDWLASRPLLVATCAHYETSLSVTSAFVALAMHREVASI